MHFLFICRRSEFFEGGGRARLDTGSIRSRPVSRGSPTSQPPAAPLFPRARQRVEYSKLKLKFVNLNLCSWAPRGSMLLQPRPTAGSDWCPSSSAPMGAPRGLHMSDRSAPIGYHRAIMHAAACARACMPRRCARSSARSAIASSSGGALKILNLTGTRGDPRTGVQGTPTSLHWATLSPTRARDPCTASTAVRHDAPQSLPPPLVARRPQLSRHRHCW